MLLQQFPKRLQLVVVSKASSNNSCVVEMVLLDKSKNSNAINTILFEFILPPFIKNAIFLYYASKFVKILKYKPCYNTCTSIIFKKENFCDANFT